MSKHAPTIIKYSFVFVIIFAVVWYVFFNTRLFRMGPQLVINSPENGYTSENKLIQVSGNTFNTSFVSINGRAINVDEEGNFNENVLLYPGYNIIIMEANDNFNRQVTKQLDIVYNINQTNDTVVDVVDSSDSDGAGNVDDAGNADDSDDADDA